MLKNNPRKLIAFQIWVGEDLGYYNSVALKSRRINVQILVHCSPGTQGFFLDILVSLNSPQQNGQGIWVDQLSLMST